MKKHSTYFLFLFVLSFVSSSVCAENTINDSVSIASYRQQQFATAMKYLRGINTEVNVDSAKVILFELAKDNFAPALRTIGTMYSTGVGLSQNFHKAYIAYYKAAKLGDAKAMTNIGVMYQCGDSVPQDFFQSYKWYKRGLKNGNIKANYYLGYLYYKGFGVEQSYKTALHYFYEGAKKGNSSSLYMLGLCYIEGNGVEQDIEKGKRFMEKAVDAGNEMAADYILYGRLSTSLQRVAQRNQTDELEQLLPRKVRQQRDNTLLANFSGSWEGKLIEYDWSGTRIKHRKDIQLETYKNGDCMDGVWTIGEETVPFSACYKDTLWQIDAEIHHNERGAKVRMQWCGLNYEQKNGQEYLTGNVQIFSLKANEPAPPSYVVLKRKQAEDNKQHTTEKTVDFSVDVIPNPIQGEQCIVYIHSPKLQTLYVSLFDTNAQCLYTESLLVTPGENTLSIPMNYPTGIYCLQLRNPEFILNHISKIVKR